MDKCYTDCPSGLYYDQFTQQCLGCSPMCKTCNPNNPNECLSCDSTSSNFTYLIGNTCNSTCPDSYFANSKSATCDKCASPCSTCSGSATSCLTCDPASGKKFQYKSTCYTSCPTGTFPDASNVCQVCNSNCLTCQTSASFCTSCPTSKLLSLYDNTCVDTCPFGLTIP